MNNDQIFKWLFPSAGIIVLSVGTIKTFFFYQLFGINILPYLTISEVGFLIFEELLISFIGIVAIVILLLLLKSRIANPNQSTEWANKYSNVSSFTNRIAFLLMQSMQVKPLLFLGAIWHLNAIYHFVENWVIIHSSIIFGLSLIVDILSYEIIRSQDISHQSRSYKLIAGIYLITTFSILIIGKAYLDYKEVLKGKNLNYSKLIFPEKEILLSKDLYLIGQTSGFVFLMNEVENKIYTYPKNDVTIIHTRN